MGYQRRKIEVVRLIISTVIALIAVYFLRGFIHFNEIISFVILLLIDIGVYFALAPSKQARIDKLKREDTKERMQLMHDANKKIRKLKFMQRNIKDKDYLFLVRDTIKTANNLMGYLDENPDKITKSRKFLTRQLDMAVDNVKDYIDVNRVDIERARVDKFEEQSKNIMKILNESYQEEFLALVEDKLVNTDIQNELLENKIQAEKRISM